MKLVTNELNVYGTCLRVHRNCCLVKLDQLFYQYMPNIYYNAVKETAILHAAYQANKGTI